MEGKVFSELMNKSQNNSQGLSTGIDLTLLDPRATENDVKELIQVAYKNKYYAVIVPPCHVKFARSLIDSKYSSALKLGTVIGFPLGYSNLKTKIVEAKDAVKNGANEIEVMINISRLKEENYAYIKYELSKLARISRKVLVKAIIETSYLSPNELERVVAVCIKSKVDMIQTSSGYAPLGADMETVEKLVSLIAKSHVKIKASGGIVSKSQAENLMRVGATRIGTSRIL